MCYIKLIYFLVDIVVIAEAEGLDSANFMLTMDNKITLMNLFSSIDSEKTNTIYQSKPCTMRYKSC